jgi:23S rRNA (pseudouridine1915-N3)-methyltransferase
MKITMLLNGLTEMKFLSDAFMFYQKRLKHYTVIEVIEIPSPKNTKSLTKEQVKEKEGELAQKHISTGDYVVLLDEHGKQMCSIEFADYIQKKMNSSIKNLVFICGGPYGFSKEIVQRSNEKLSLSQMTFSHQMVRVFFAEQLYRAFTIIKKEPYHHE